MADFHLWNHENLVKFAEAATKKMDEQSTEIAQLKADFKTMQLAWREALRRYLPGSTLREAKATLPK